MTSQTALRIRRSAGRAAASCRRGITLLEALTALVLAGILTAGVGFALSTGLDASRRLREQSDANLEARSALRILADDLSSAFLSEASPSLTFFVARAAAEGGEGASPSGGPLLSFTTLSHRRAASPALAPRSDAVRVDYMLQPVRRTGAQGTEPRSASGSAETFALLRRERWLTETGPGETDVICERVAGLRVRFPDLPGASPDAAPEPAEGRWDAAPEPDPKRTVRYGEEKPDARSTRTLPRTVEVTLLIAPPPDAPPARSPRFYRTLVLVGADGVAPFEPETLFPPPQGQPDGDRGGRSGGGRRNGGEG